MQNGMSGLSSDLKEFFDNGINRLTVIVLLFALAILATGITTNVNICQLKKLVQTESKNTRNSVHFRYFNLTNSLEDIHRIKLDTKDGHKTN